MPRSGVVGRQSLHVPALMVTTMTTSQHKPLPHVSLLHLLLHCRHPVHPCHPVHPLHRVHSSHPPQQECQFHPYQKPLQLFPCKFLHSDGRRLFSSPISFTDLQLQNVLQWSLTSTDVSLSSKSV